MSTQKKLITLCFATVFTLGLAACGSSGGNKDTAMDEDTSTKPEPTRPPSSEDQLAEARAAVTAAELVVEAAMTASERAAAYTQLAAAETLLAEAESIPENALTDLRQRLADAEGDLDAAETEAMNFQNALDAISDAVDAINMAQTEAAGLDEGSDRAAIDAAGALVTAAQTAINAVGADDQAGLQSQLDSANYMVMAAQTTLDNAAMVAAATMAAGTKRMAITTEAGESGTDDAGVGGSVETGVASTYTLTVARDRDGTKITIVDTANLADADPANPQFALAMDLGGGRTKHVRAMDANDEGEVVEEVVIVSTDIDAPTATPFAMVPGQMLNVRQDGETMTDDDPNDALTIMTVSVDDGADDVNLPKIMAARFTAGTKAELEFPNNDMTTDDKDEAFETAGTYNGAMGTYRCNGTAACTVDINAMGKISGIGDGWIFTPAMGATSDVPDANYLYYGFWLKKTTDEDGTTYNEVETFAMATGHLETDDTNLVGVLGTATYTGDSVGVYVKNVLDDQANITSATSGHFRADVELNANFTGGNVAPNDRFTIGGKITDFALAGARRMTGQ